VRPAAPEEIALAAAVAVIDEARCIGCTLCIAACPVDAIVGAARLMHSVVTSICTGCELCLAPCPVDCISMRSYPRPDADSRDAATAEARHRCEARNARLEGGAAQTAAQRLARAAAAAERRKRATIARALERATLRLNSRQP
jgi:electron transport complex protein RnfB